MITTQLNTPAISLYKNKEPAHLTMSGPTTKVKSIKLTQIKF